ncbi:MAG: acyl carrier protein [Sinobacteraceae bacterium]|nr:acyl carrier protein [Nevskiaceae bacterium]
MSTLETLQTLIREEFKHSAEQLGPQTTLAELGIDSLELVDLIFKIEDRFGLKIKEDVPRSLVTLGDVATYVDELLAKKSAEGQAGADRPS